jgi:hypothetical protein
MPKWAITIGSYAMPDFVELNVRQCQSLFPDGEILVSDDASGMESLAAKLGVMYTTSEKRRSHCSGDWQTFVHAASLGVQENADYCLKLSQRLIPCREGFRTLLETSLAQHDVVLPCSMDPRVVTRPGQVMYTRFPILTDVVAWRTGALDPETLIRVYREACGNKAFRRGQIVEYAMHSMLTVSGLRLARCPELASRQSPPLFLRKSSSHPMEYMELAKAHGITGAFSCAEWKDLEGSNYRPVASVV